MANQPDPHPLEELRLALSDLAEHVAVERRAVLAPVGRASLRRIVAELERHIPGLEPPPDARAARLLASAAAAALFHNREREALVRSLRGLSCAPHDPELHYLAASACLELGAVREALCLLAHTLWIHPGHPAARRDLEALTAFRGVWGLASGDGQPDAAADPSPPPFELLEEGVVGDDFCDLDLDFWPGDGAWMEEPGALEGRAEADDAPPPEDEFGGDRRAA
ncbi:MAG TPA: hypothetical protein VGK93_13235 [Candidatus Eisenbacteria bacterium]|jgi:hypothetical protein